MATAIRRDRKWWKERWVADHYAKLKSPAILLSYMEHKGYSFSELARRATRERREMDGKAVTRQMLQQLAPTEEHPRAKVLSTCSTELAAAVERVLDAPDHSIFDVLPKSPDKRHTNTREATAA